MSKPRIEYTKRIVPKLVHKKTKAYIVYSLSLNFWDSYSVFSEESRPDSIS